MGEEEEEEVVDDDDERPIHSRFLLVRSLEKGGVELSERERVCSKGGGLGWKSGAGGGKVPSKHISRKTEQESL